MGMIPVIRQMAVLLLLIAVGFVANKCHVMGKEEERTISKIIINISCPAMIINSVTTSGRLDSTSFLLVIFAVAIVYYLAMPFAAKGIIRLFRMPSAHRDELESMFVYSNLGFMGIPVIGAILGQESILYISIFIAIFNISIFSYGLLLLGGGKSGAALSRMINPGTVSALAAVALYLLNVQLPSLLLQPIASLGSTTTPLAMVVIGSSLAGQSIGEMLKDKSLYLFSAIRLLLLPALCLFVCRWFLGGSLLLGTMVLLTAMPVASNVVMLRSEMGGEGDYVARGVAFSTLLSVLTIPVISALLEIFG